jgi:hypothetical protein
MLRIATAWVNGGNGCWALEISAHPEHCDGMAEVAVTAFAVES